MAKAPYGILIFHGLSDNPNAVIRIEQPLRAMGLPIHIPLLRGHGTDSPEALRGVTWQDWLADGERALQNLLKEVDKAIVIGHSMGGLVAITLASEYPDTIDSIVLAAAGIQPKSPIARYRPMHFIVPIMVRFLKKLDFPPVYADAELAKQHNSYPWVPTDAIASVLKFSIAARKHLPQIRIPTLILQSRKDSMVVPSSAEFIYQSISTPADKKKIVWFNKTNHELFRDCERDAVATVITDYVRERIGQAA